VKKVFVVQAPIVGRQNK